MRDLFIKTFLMILVMEIGSRSQFAIAALASSSDRPVVIWIASILALSTTCFIAVLMGKWIEMLPISANLVSGLVMTTMGIYLLWKS